MADRRVPADRRQGERRSLIERRQESAAISDDQRTSARRTIDRRIAQRRAPKDRRKKLVW